jgi:hypothetical protein
MTIYNAHFRTDSQFAIVQIEAETPEKALAKAQAIVADEFDILTFRNYDGAFPVNEIAICHEDDCDELAVWYDEDLHVRLAASDLLSAARLVIARWESGDLAEAMRELSAAVAKAEGGAA